MQYSTVLMFIFYVKCELFMKAQRDITFMVIYKNFTQPVKCDCMYVKMAL
jgi:hypothetical protein